MAKSRIFALLVTLILINSSHESIDDNEVDVDKFADFAKVAGEMMGQNGGDLSGMISSFMSSEGGKQIGEMIMSQGLSAMLGGASGAPGGLDMDMIANFANLASTFAGAGKETPRGPNDGFDFSSIANFAAQFSHLEGAGEFMKYLPQVMNILSNVMGPEAEKTAKQHEGHAWLFPPFFEKMHILLDQLMNSDFGKMMIRKIGAEKVIKMFNDDEGNFSSEKCTELLENHSFRKHWIQMVVSRMSDMLAVITVPETQQRFMDTVKFFMNNFLKSYGVPKHALFDPMRPAESLTALANYIPKRYMGVKFNAAPYVVPAVAYCQDLTRLARSNGILGRAITANELTHKLTDTLNLEIIEPLARVNRAVRFAKKVPQCTRYVLCVANQHEPDEMLSLPGLKKTLATGATLLGCWRTSGQNSAPLWSEFALVSEGKQCEKYYNEKCNNFHVEEEKVTTEYIHNEL